MSVELSIFNFLNKLRTEPQSFLQQLKDLKDKTDQNVLATTKLKNDMKEAVQFLEKKKPQDPFLWVENMAKVAQNHVEDLCKNGVVTYG